MVMVHRQKVRYYSVLFGESGRIMQDGMPTRGEFKELVGKYPSGEKGDVRLHRGHVRFRKVVIDGS